MHVAHEMITDGKSSRAAVPARLRGWWHDLSLTATMLLTGVQPRQ